ncbi:BatA domain-containing protein [Aquimarina gracilis]|uniref:BatA domain-containing protein n=1 Tax=Aquimarina gracilis TaxID=874422 RepID=A0ABU5ZUX3_9FLAO|nr:BatA domain-containing protein [Aquimarina gracilis]MEB3345803.1 BatA domain-containing protein [Aquimarina gracilis]
MSFLNPAYLWALFGLLIPVAIHLWSEKEGKTIKVGSTKLFNETDSKKSSSIQLNEWVLLLLRMLLITLLVSILAGPRIIKKIDIVPVTYIVEPSLLKEDKIRSILDTLEIGTSLRLLKPNFPEFQEQELDFGNIETPNYWQLARNMETLKTDSIVVFTKAHATGLKGIRPKMNKKNSWIILNSEEEKGKVLQAVKKEKEIELLSMSNTHEHTFFEKELYASDNDFLTYNKTKDSVSFLLNNQQKTLELNTEEDIEVLLSFEDSLSNQAKYIDASLKAISRYTQKPIVIEKRKPLDTSNIDRFDLVIWLHNDSIPNTSARLLVPKTDYLSNDIIVPGPNRSLFYLTKWLTSESIIEQHFSEQLLGLFDLYSGLEKEIEKSDIRTVALKELLPKTGKQKVKAQTSSFFDISQWFWLLFVIGTLAERFLAKLRKQ